MGTACWNCKYISTDMQYCGKGLAVRASRNCSGYIEGPPLGNWTMYPGCPFPVSDHVERHLVTVGWTRVPQMYQSYSVETYNDALSYTVEDLTWVRKILDDVGVGGWTMDMNTYVDGSTKVDIYNPPTPLNTQSSIEKSTGRQHSLDIINNHNSVVGPEPLWWAWWVDPTLSYEEGIPMYALLLAVDKMASGTRSSLLKALEIGHLCKGKTVQEWSQVIANSDPPLCHKVSLTISKAIPGTYLWKIIHSQWWEIMDRMHEWLNN